MHQEVNPGPPLLGAVWLHTHLREGPLQLLVTHEPEPDLSPLSQRSEPEGCCCLSPRTLIPLTLGGLHS